MEPALSGSASGDSLRSEEEEGLVGVWSPFTWMVLSHSHRTSYRVAAALVKTCPRLIYSKVGVATYVLGSLPRFILFE